VRYFGACGRSRRASKRFHRTGSADSSPPLHHAPPKPAFTSPPAATFGAPSFESGPAATRSARSSDTKLRPEELAKLAADFAPITIDA
jgi:hypothetical protein